MTAQALPPIVRQALSVDRTAAMAALYAPSAAREALCSLVAFRHEVAKTAYVVSEPMLGEIRLQWWDEAIAQIFADPARAPRHEVVQPLAEAVFAFGLRESDFHDLIAAHRAALYPVEAADGAALRAHLGGLERPLLALSTAVLGGSLPDAEQAAAEILGLAGWCRRLSEDRAERRLVVPAAEMAAHGLDMVKLIDFQPGPEFDALVADLARAGLARLAAVRPRRALRPAFLPVVAARRTLSMLAARRHPALSAPAADADPLLAARMGWAMLAGL